MPPVMIFGGRLANRSSGVWRSLIGLVSLSELQNPQAELFVSGWQEVGQVWQNREGR
jgi:hypothetical protein